VISNSGTSTDVAALEIGQFARLTRAIRASINEFSWIWIALIVLYAVSAVLAPGTIRPSSIYATLPFAAILAVVAAGQTLVIQQRGLDLSCGPMVSLGGALLARIYFGVDSLPIAIVSTLGSLNGFLISKVNIMPIVATLATNAVFLGITQSVTSGTAIISPTPLSDLVNRNILRLPNSVIFSVLFILVLAALINKTRIGRNFIVVGASPRTAAAAGIPVLRYEIGTYACASICFALAGVVLAGFVGSASHRAGNDYLLPGIAAVVVGGTSFVGGRGSVIASGVAAVFMIQLGQMVQAMGASSSIQFLVQALAIIVATLVGNIPTLMKRVFVIRG
jgi:ribose transport system permease protein